LSPGGAGEARGEGQAVVNQDGFFLVPNAESVSEILGYIEEAVKAAGAHFPCFTGTKVQMLTQLRRRSGVWQRLQFTCFTGKKVQVLTGAGLVYGSDISLLP
jgi:hypothetical protein